MKINQLISKVQPVLEKFSFVEGDSTSGPMNSGIAEYHATKISLRLVTDRGQPFIDIAKRPNGDWFDLRSVLVVLKYFDIEAALTIDSQVRFLVDNFPVLESLLDAPSGESINRLKKAQNDKAAEWRQLFRGK